MTEPIHEAIRDSYEAIAYTGRPYRETSPAYLAALGHLHGLALPDPTRLAVLEIGSGDGSNLLPLADAHPGGRFVGIDQSARLTADARTTATSAGLANVRLIEDDLRALPADAGRFDVIIAHGMYSWMPPDIRDAMLAVVARHLAPGGLVFVSYNALPGGYLRRVGFDALRFGLRTVKAPAERVARARELLDVLVETWRSLPPPGPAFAATFAREQDRDDSAIFHDDLATINDAFYVSDFSRHATSHGLVAFADADQAASAPDGISSDTIARWQARGAAFESQMLDFAHVRQFRQTLCTNAGTSVRARPDPARVAALHWSAGTGYMQRRLAGGVPADPLGDWLAGRFPAVHSYAELADAMRALGMRADELPARVERARVEGIAEPFAWPIAIASRPGARPSASALARWQAGHRDLVANRRHVGVRLADDVARALLPLCDGTRTHDDFARDLRAISAFPANGDAAALVRRHLAQFASAALLDA